MSTSSLLFHTTKSSCLELGFVHLLPKDAVEDLAAELCDVC